MTQPANLNPRIIEALYAEGLMLSDEVRAAFDLSHRPEGDCEDETRIALSCEALRTTTRMMHALAWLLNHRAYFKGEISEFQLRRHGRIATGLPVGDPARLALLDPATQDLIVTTERFYARLVRLDAGWRMAEPQGRPAIERLRERIASSASLG
jgi:regulator of CtrA degradation